MKQSTVNQRLDEVRALVTRLGGRVFASVTVRIGQPFDWSNPEEVDGVQVRLVNETDVDTFRRLLAEYEPDSRHVSWLPESERDAARYHVGGKVRGVLVYCPVREDVATPILGPDALAAKAAKLRLGPAPREVAV